MRSGRLLNVPFSTQVYEATFGEPVDIEYRLAPESETSFFDDSLSIDIVLNDEGKLAKFLLLHPWFVQHVVFVWRVKEKTQNVMVQTFHAVTMEPGKTIVCRVKVDTVDTLTACQVIEDSRNTIETYDGTGASKMKEEYESRKYYKSGLIPRLDI
jgi:hypothetical protein